MLTHLFNAMAPFLHRDPGLVGLLSSDQLVPEKPLFYGVIADNIHTHPAALRMAVAAHPTGCVLVTDAIGAMEWPHTHLKLGSMEVEIHDNRATLLGTDTLAGSIATMDFCVREFAKIGENGRQRH
jgi:N-acetylglucosamine-6-phosphate deacetylase